MGAEIQALAVELGVARHIRFHGFLTQRELRPIVEAAHVGVISSRHEAGPLVVLEAAAVGVPTVGTAVGHIAEWSPRAALAVPCQDPAALAAALESVLEDEDLRMRLANEAHHARSSKTPSIRRTSSMHCIASCQVAGGPPPVVTVVMSTFNRLACFCLTTGLGTESSPYRGTRRDSQPRYRAGTRSRCVAFLDSDDLWAAEKLQRQLELMESKPARRWSYTAVRRIDADGLEIRSRPVPFVPYAGWVFEQVLRVDAQIGTPTVMAELAFVRELGGFDEKIPIRRGLRSVVANGAGK